MFRSHPEWRSAARQAVFALVPVLVGAGILGVAGDKPLTVMSHASALEREWMASPGHRRNILTGAFTVVGVGAWTDGDGTCWVQVLFSS